MQRRSLLKGLPALLPGAAWAAQPSELLVTLRAPDSETDLRSGYIRDAVKLALEKTRITDGPFRLQMSPPMNKPRALVEASRRTLPNFLISTGPEQGREAGLAPVLFPLLLGANRYRVCFVHAPRQAQVREAVAAGDISRLRHVQGRGWADVATLRANGLLVDEVNTYDAMFELVALGRADLFCRHVLEVGAEARVHAGRPGLVLDDSLLLAYEQPHYLYTHPDNRVVIDRMARGFGLAFNDGSLQALLRKRLQPALALLNLPQRRLFMLQSPAAALVEMNDKPYYLDLLRPPR
ncbi:hypothetical protein DBR42_17840 [Pelomonas sp. HMWF004]|nr:hypothetical protein DBR42_17840 [Pelomonas sp. HMWF004]